MSLQPIENAVTFENDKPLSEDAERRPLMSVKSKSMSQLFTEDNPLDSALSTIGFGRYQKILFAACILCGILWNASWPQLAFMSGNRTFNERAGITPFVMSLWGIAGSTGGCFGILGGYLGDLIGRHRVMWWFSLGLGVLGIVAAFTINSVTYILLQEFFVCVLNISLSSLPVIILMEFCPPANRGRYSLLVSLATTWGTGYVAILTFIFMSSTYGPNSTPLAITTEISPWRWLYALVAILEVPILILLYIVPYESPRYLLKKGRGEETYEILQKVIEMNQTCDFNDIPSLEEFKEYAQKLADEQNQEIQPTFWSMWNEFISVPETPYAVVGFAVLVGMQWTFFSFVGVFLAKSSINVNLMQLIAGVATPIPAIAILMWQIDNPQHGRLRFIQSLYGLFVASMVGMTFFDKPVAYLILYPMWMFAFVPCSATFVLFVPELYPTRVRGFALSMMFSIANATEIVLVSVGAVLLAQTNARVYVGTFAAITFIGWMATFGIKSDMVGKEMY